MADLHGRITNIRIYEQEGHTDWALAISKICWFAIWIMAPFSCFRFINDLFGLIPAIAGVMILLFFMRLVGPLQYVLLDELFARIFPNLRSAIRFGRVRVYDFRVQDKSARKVACIIKGDLRGGIPMAGDHVRLQGVYRGGILQVNNGHNETTDSVIAPVFVYSGWIFMGTLTLVLFFFLYLWGTFDNLIYPLFIDLWNTLYNQTGQV